MFMPCKTFPLKQLHFIQSLYSGYPYDMIHLGMEEQGSSLSQATLLYKQTLIKFRMCTEHEAMGIERGRSPCLQAY